MRINYIDEKHEDFVWYNMRIGIVTEVTTADVVSLIDWIKEAKPQEIDIVLAEEGITDDQVRAVLETIADAEYLKQFSIKSSKQFSINSSEQGDYFFNYLSDRNIPLLLSKPVLTKILYTLLNVTNASSMHIAPFLTNENIVEQLLTSEEARPILESITPKKQSFSNSCAAFAIMKLLYGNTAEFNLLNELKIYREIWSAPGKIADPSKIRAFLENNGFTVELVVDAKVAEKALGNNADLKRIFSFFRSSFEPKQIHDEGITEETFVRKTSQLILTQSGSHIIVAVRADNGMIELQDSARPKVTIFDSPKALLESADQAGDADEAKLREFVGISLSVQRKV